MTEREARTAVLSWDWRQQPDLAELGRLVADLSGGAVYLREVEDTGSDEYALVVSTADLDAVAAREVYERWLDEQAGPPVVTIDTRGLL